jgi:hypothetical protein
MNDKTIEMAERDMESFINCTIKEAMDGKYSSLEANLRGSITAIRIVERKQGLKDAAEIGQSFMMQIKQYNQNPIEEYRKAILSTAEKVKEI